MTALEIIEQIDSKLAKLPEQKLESILKFINEQSIAADIDTHLNTIIAEDDNLLKRLAQ